MLESHPIRGLSRNPDMEKMVLITFCRQYYYQYIREESELVADFMFKRK